MKALGFPRMHKEENEKRDFLPDFFARFIDYDVDMFLEEGYGSGMGISQEEYLDQNPKLKFVSNRECYEKDIVVVLRCPEVFEMDYIKEGSTLVSMLHYPTRATRVKYLKERDIFGVSMDAIRNDVMDRIVVDYGGTSGNGVDIAFRELGKALEKNRSIENEPIRVSIIGMGSVGQMAAKYAGKFGGKKNEEKFRKHGIDSVMINMLSRNITSNRVMMEGILSETDILIDASNRKDPSTYIVDNSLLDSLRGHSIILDLSADPYLMDVDPIQVKAIEGIPTGTLDKAVFYPEDKAYEVIPESVSTNYRRTVVSCNAWPGIAPRRCMELYGIQLTPVIKRLIKCNKNEYAQNSDNFFSRAIHRATIEFFEKTQ